MKLCELKVNVCEDRADIVKILVFAGYKVSIETRKRKDGYYGEQDYFVIVESKEEQHGTA